MRVVKLIAALVAALTIRTVVVASASAAETLWRWLPGASKTAFTGSGEKTTFQVKGGLSVTCSSSSSTGEITESQTLTLGLLSLKTCTTTGLPVNSLGDASGIVLIHTEVHNCWIPFWGARVKVLPVHLEVPSTKLLLTVEGAYLDEIKGIIGSLQKQFSLVAEQKEGKQTIEKCEGAGADSLLTSVDGGALTQTGFEQKGAKIEFSTGEESMES